MAIAAARPARLARQLRSRRSNRGKACKGPPETYSTCGLFFRRSYWGGLVLNGVAINQAVIADQRQWNWIEGQAPVGGDRPQRENVQAGQPVVRPAHDQARRPVRAGKRSVDDERKAVAIEACPERGDRAARIDEEDDLSARFLPNAPIHLIEQRDKVVPFQQRYVMPFGSGAQRCDALVAEIGAGRAHAADEREN